MQDKCRNLEVALAQGAAFCGLIIRPPNPNLIILIDMRDAESLINAKMPMRQTKRNQRRTAQRGQHIQRRKPLEDFPEETWRELMTANLDSVFYVSKAVARHMIPRKKGSIINICSVMSELGRPTVVPYTAAKGGVKMLTKGMAVDWGKHGIRVNGIGPGYFKTELNAALVADAKFSSWIAGRAPLGRWGNVDELVGAAVFLASDAASFVTGHVLYVDGGMTGSL